MNISIFYGPRPSYLIRSIWPVPFDIGLIADILNSDKIEVGCIYDRQKGNKRQIFMKGESCDFAAEHGLISLNVLLANG